MSLPLIVPPVGLIMLLHVSALEQAGISTLKEGEEIEFEIGENKGKQNAINIKKVVNGSG